GISRAQTRGRRHTKARFASRHHRSDTCPGGSVHMAPWLFATAAMLSVNAFHLFAPAERAPKTTGVHPSFPAFVRVAYGWLVVATLLGICAAYLDRANGWIG